ncbi:fungal-specific transcription factor domain-containing protein [Trametes elegans]|nr:fungal-specific transcription factor domain-containing protein [Trametes elegans]
MCTIEHKQRPHNGADTSPTVQPTPDASVPVTLTKSGNVSKLRSHRGNAPSLPQTKVCHLCSAKFTRKTHLNRHLKTHSNERLHQCERCHAQFTRRDLLNRHRGTCSGDPSMSGSRSKKRSCQSCAKGKVKCDMQQPCARCGARGYECVYPASLPPASEEAQRVHEPASSSAPSMGSIDVLAFQAPGTSAASTGFPHSAGSSLDMRPTPTSTQAMDEHTYLSELFSTEMFDDLFSDVFMSSFDKHPSIPGRHFHQDSTPLITDQLDSTAAGFSNPLGYDAPAQLAIYDTPPSDPPFSLTEFENFLNAVPMSLTPAPSPEPSGQPTAAELNDYMIHFLTTFSYHMPLLHIPTLFLEECCPILITAMRACGAMYAHTPAAEKFIESVLATTRDEIIAELSSNTKNYDEVVQLTMASGLVQTIGLFHRDSEQRAKSNVYHGVIVMMLRMNGFVDQTRDWEYKTIDFSDPAAVERAWRDWIKHESAKRSIWICYSHDCCHSIFFNHLPTLQTEFFTLGLPSEDGLWSAKSATEWATLLQTPSAYGPVETRLCGLHLKAVYFYVTSDNPKPGRSPRPFSISPFAHFVLIQATMRHLFEKYLRDRLPPAGSEAGGAASPALRPHVVDKARTYHIQILLHYWLQSWLSSPETPRDVPAGQRRFYFDPLPFYWITQVGLVAYQEGLPPFEPEGAYVTSHDAKFVLLKKWERHIRAFLAGGERAPTRFWDEVMKIRIDTWQAETGFEYENLLGFFQDLGVN